TTISAGTLQIGGVQGDTATPLTSGTTGTLGGGDVNITGATANLQFNRSNAYTVNNLIHGIGNVIERGAGGTLILGGANDYSGTTTVSAGTLQLNNVSALGTTAGGTTV